MPVPQAANAGAAKAAMPFGKTVLLGVVAGAYVGLCAALLMTGGWRWWGELCGVDFGMWVGGIWICVMGWGGGLRCGAGVGLGWGARFWGKECSIT